MLHTRNLPQPLAWPEPASDPQSNDDDEWT